MEIPEMLEEMLRRISAAKTNILEIARAQAMFKMIEKGGDVCRLKRALYGLDQTGWQWQVKSKIEKLGS